LHVARIASKDASVEHGVIHRNSAVRVQKRAVFGGAIGVNLECRIRTDDVEQNLVGGKSSGKHNRAAKMGVAIRNVYDHVIDAIAVDRQGGAVDETERRHSEYPVAVSIESAAAGIDRLALVVTNIDRGGRPRLAS